MIGRRFTAAPGMATTAAALVMVSVTASTVALTADSMTWLAIRAAAIGLVLAAAGVMIGSSGLIGVATFPILSGALAGLDSGDGQGWGRSLIIGCLWYVSAELAWSAIERRAETEWAPAITWQRSREVATVVIIAVTVGLGAAGLASMAPSRTLFVRAVLAAAVLVSLAGALRQVVTTGTPSGEGPDRPTRTSA
jgi:hypothetical protein